ncbi:MAG: hypothetical protein QMD85_01830, partial [Candidatus Aenigmarchaeota archaeon]|nr:hypothetical protein [Candidatus Aenigmarchaeota archaeon]
MAKHSAPKKVSKKNIQASKSRTRRRWRSKKVYAVVAIIIIALLVVLVYTGFVMQDTNAPDSCVDTDGNDYFVKGTSRGTLEGTHYSFEDLCSGDMLKEFYCKSNKIIAYLYQCPNGCSKGACV